VQDCQPHKRQKAEGRRQKAHAQNGYPPPPKKKEGRLSKVKASTAQNQEGGEGTPEACRHEMRESKGYGTFLEANTYNSGHISSTQQQRNFHPRNEDPMYGCQIGTACPILNAKQDQPYPIGFSGARYLHAHRPYWQEDREGLPDLVVQAVVPDALDENLVDVAQHVEVVGQRHVAQHTHAEARAFGTPNDTMRQTEAKIDRIQARPPLVPAVRLEAA
jgi:hypothetical protein